MAQLFQKNHRNGGKQEKTTKIHLPWLYANVSDIKSLVGDELVASAIKSAMAELAPNEVTNRTKIEPLAQQKLLTIGLVNDMFTERQNDDYPYKELASQHDMDVF